MTSEHEDPFHHMAVDHVELYVADLASSVEWFTDHYGLTAHADNAQEAARAGARSVALHRANIRVVLTQGLADDHPSAVYVAQHGDGVGNIALHVPDATAAYEEAVRRGAQPCERPATRDGVVTASITGFADVSHRFVERSADIADDVLPGLRPVTGRAPALDSGLAAIDHFAVCLEAGMLEATVDYYERALGFDMVFEELIVVGAQSMISKVVQSTSGAVTLTLIEPDLSRQAGQIDEFIKRHDGSGVQHIAFNSADIARSVSTMKAGGVSFLHTPGAYYELLEERLTVRRHPIGDLRAHDILMDEDHDGQLFQIFAKSVHPRGTLFMEVIERAGARTFGSGNIKALYEAVELQRQQDGPVT
ncbi:4-hydroxyphenylpyruvate dioxygenase [Streptomyces platensis]|uniref:4-hydroxyphenylpyruvate dioxygenase n=1 Tax=Streptomyces platensis TaxID=58346 RepID=UPI002E0DFA4E|nr:4-hydroxyphenylpyruvate dioxygenase [Streptomyces platensis]WSI59792.1 4-hydroxyphenylpyruvate dioxygenase [Streptomyces platensis]